MKKTPARQYGHFAGILNAGMQQLDITIRELCKQLRISHEHASRLQAGEVLPSRLLVEESAKVVGIPVEQLQRAVDRDRLARAKRLLTSNVSSRKRATRNSLPD